MGPGELNFQLGDKRSPRAGSSMSGFWLVLTCDIPTVEVQVAIEAYALLERTLVGLQVGARERDRSDYGRRLTVNLP